MEQRGVWYKAKVLQVRDAQQLKDKDDVEHARYWEVHYMGWHERWDMWVGVKETKKATKETEREVEALNAQRKTSSAKKSKGKKNGTKRTQEEERGGEAGHHYNRHHHHHHLHHAR